MIVAALSKMTGADGVKTGCWGPVVPAANLNHI